MKKQNKVKKTFQIDLEAVDMLNELVKFHGSNLGTTINQIIKHAHKQMNADLSFSNTRDVENVLKVFDEKLKNLELKNIHLEGEVEKLKEKLSKAVEVINRHTTELREKK